MVTAQEKLYGNQRNGTQPSQKGPPEWFTGNVRIDSLFQRTDPARVGGAIVTFEPRARTAWHTHPLGQTLIVTSGVWTQCEGGPVDERNLFGDPRKAPSQPAPGPPLARERPRRRP
jgi:hypothetical protein